MYRMYKFLKVIQLADSLLLLPISGIGSDPKEKCAADRLVGCYGSEAFIGIGILYLCTE